MSTAPRYYYVYNGHGDVVGLVDAQGTAVTTYRYDEFGQVLVDTDPSVFTTGWRNPYLYDGKDRVRYDPETGLYWMSVRAYDPTLGRFLSRDPEGRAPLLGLATQPYVYADNNPLRNVDPSGQRLMLDGGGGSTPTLTPTGSGGSSRMHTTTCNPDAASASDHCVTLGKHAGDLRKSRLESIGGPLFWGVAKQLLGYVAVIVADVYLLVKGKTSEKFEGAIDLIATFVNSIIPLLVQMVKIFAPQAWWITSAGWKISAALNGILGILHGAYRLYQGLGDWAWAAIDAGLRTISAVEAPVPTATISLVQYLVPNAVSYLDMGAHALIAWGQSDMADWQYQNDMSIVSWCQQYSGGAGQCSELLHASA